MLLKLGSTGEDVVKLQQKLGVDPIGKFGPKTEAAVKEWQAKNGLTADGVVGDTTWKKLMGITESAPASAPQLITEPAPAPVANVGGLKLSALKGHVPDSVISMIPEVATKFGIDTPVKLAHFLSQCGHESGGFKITQENLNYSAKGLMGIFKKYFPDEATANAYQRNPEKIANRVYSGRMGNGPEASGEGYKFRGRGFIQLTGKDNYTAFGKAINEDIASKPEKVGTDYALLSAAWFFSKNCLKKCVDASDATVTSVTKCVNGGTIGLEDRKKHFKEFYNLLS
jgi:putative chitinase